VQFFAFISKVYPVKAMGIYLLMKTRYNVLLSRDSEGDFEAHKGQKFKNSGLRLTLPDKEELERCMYMCVCVIMPLCMYIYIYIYIYIYVCVCMHSLLLPKHIVKHTSPSDEKYN
jgi:hypothetical protein